MDNAYYAVSKPDSFGSYEGLRRQCKKSESEIKDWLSNQDAYTMHKSIKRRFKRRKTYAMGIDDLWQIDLVDLSSISRANDGYRYLLMCIDVLSKYGRIELVKSKNAVVVKDAFARMITDRKPNLLQSDKGTEFLNVTFQQFLKINDIRHYTSENDDIKCAIVERWNRTILTKLFRYLTYANTHRYVDVIQDITLSYNNTFHSSIKMAPSDVTVQNEHEVRVRLFPTKPKKIKWKFAKGDTVRISGARRHFEKGYKGNWSEEIFKVAVLYSTFPPTYGLTDYIGEEIKGKFYAEELQKVAKEVFKIEKVLKTRRRAGKTEYYVKWIGYPEKFNSWVDNINAS